MSQQPRATHHDFDPQVLVLFDAYVHGDLDRRGFLARVSELVGGAAAIGVLGALAPQFAQAQQVASEDERIKTGYAEFPSPQGYGSGRGYRAMPAGADSPLPRVLVIHENRGLNPHIEDVARRLALAGYDAFAPDALFPLGGYPGDEDTARSQFGKLDQTKCRADFLAAAAWFEAEKGGNGRLGAVGFCYGGAITNFLAVELPQLSAAAPYYGGPAPLDKVANIKAELLVVLAADDPRINDSWPAFSEALQKHGVVHSLFQPADTVHGFHNDTTPRYSEAAAKEAWSRTLDLFERRLRS